MAIAQGPVMIGNAKKPNDPKVGRVLGGGRVKKESPYMLVIKEKREACEPRRSSKAWSTSGSTRPMPASKRGRQPPRPMATWCCRVPPSYHQNQERFFRVVQLLHMVDTPALRAQRMAAWGKELLDPNTSGVAALRLEGLGVSASRDVA